jgi:hypothetical protein
MLKARKAPIKASLRGQRVSAADEMTLIDKAAFGLAVGAAAVGMAVLVASARAENIAPAPSTDAPIETPEEPDVVKPAPGLLCYTAEGWKPAPCNPVNDVYCPINICALTYPVDRCADTVQVGECEMFHEDGTSFREHYCACFETARALWEGHTGQTFPYAKTKRCGQ